MSRLSRHKTCQCVRNVVCHALLHRTMLISTWLPIVEEMKSIGTRLLTDSGFEPSMQRYVIFQIAVAKS